MPEKSREPMSSSAFQSRSQPVARSFGRRAFSSNQKKGKSMAYGSRTFATIGAVIANFVSPAFAALYSALDAFFRAVMLVASPYAWRTAHEIGVAAFRKISDLKPVYRESYESHGLSLDHRMRT
jgi:hypothetical protein